MTDMAPGVTNVGYWDEAAKDWDCVHDTFATDEKGVIAKNLAQHCRNDQQVIDFGCGGGRYLRYLSSRCGLVLGIDISPALLAIARRDVVQRYKIHNCELRCADLGAPSACELALPTCSLGVCTNVQLCGAAHLRTRANILSLMATGMHQCAYLSGAAHAN